MKWMTCITFSSKRNIMAKSGMRYMPLQSLMSDINGPMGKIFITKQHHINTKQNADLFAIPTQNDTLFDLQGTH